MYALLVAWPQLSATLLAMPEPVDDTLASLGVPPCSHYYI